MSTQSFMFRRTGTIVVPMRGNDFKPALVASFDANLRRLGYALNGEAFLALGYLPALTLENIAKEVIAEAKRIKGVKRYSPMYPNFPKQVMEASDAELYVNAVMHYFGDAVGVRIMPQYETEKRAPLDFDESRLKFIGISSRNDFENTLMSVVNQKAAWSEQDREDIKEFISELALIDLSRFELPNRENKVLLVKYFYDESGLILSGGKFRLDTATDVLRLAVALSDGDVSLAEKTEFKSFSRKTRRSLLDALEKAGGLDEDFARRPEAFKRLGERLHPREYANRYPITASAFATLRDAKRKPETFSRTVERLIENRDVNSLTSHLATRPGEFLRRLDQVARLSRNSNERAELVRKLAMVADKASSPVLLQARAALSSERGKVRVFFPKGQVSKFQTVADSRKALSKSFREELVDVIDAALVKKFSEKEPLGLVYVDPVLDAVTVPLAVRDSSKGRVLGRGSRVSFNKDEGVLRFFIWWRDLDTPGYGGRVDIDLSAVLLDENFNEIETVSYYNLRGLGGTHSGDITSAPNGASEFIDIDPSLVRGRGARYVAMTVHSYSRQKLRDIPEVFAGFMQRENANSGEIYDPRTVENRVDLTTPSHNSVPYIFDVVTGEAIWVDMSVKFGGHYGYGGNNAASTMRTTQNLVSGVVNRTYPNLGHLFKTHAQARGTLVDTPEQADVVFNMENAHRVEEVLDKYL